MPDIIRILLTDDHEIVRQGLRALIDTQSNLEVVGEASNGLEAVEQVRKLNPDVILLDLVMPKMGGIEVIKQLRADKAEVQILVLTSFDEDEQVFSAIKSGALGYLLKDSAPQELIESIHAVYRGEASLHPTIALKLIRELKQPPDLPPTIDPLTLREVEVLKLLARGMSNQDISETLVISERTVGTHVSNILEKLHLANRTQAALYALREGLASLDE